MRLGSLLLLLALSTVAQGELVVLDDGDRVEASVRFEGGRLLCQRLQPAGVIPTAEIVEVRFRPEAVPAAPASGLVRAGLRTNQHCAGELLSLEEGRLRLRLPWTKELTFPRGALVSLTQPRRVGVFAMQQHQAADPEQDELWLTSGDQLCGKIVALEREQVAWRDGERQRHTPWNTARGLFFRQRPPVERAVRGWHVRVGLAGWDSEPDVLVGVLRGLDATTLTLEHRDLGELKLPRRFVSWLRPTFSGTRIELDNRWHHLGPRGRLEVRLTPPRATGPAWQKTFALERRLDRVNVVLQVRGLRGVRDGEPKRYERGELGTALLLNGQRIAVLNLLVEQTSWGPTELSVALPVQHLRVGENVLEVRQLPEPGSGQLDSVGIGAVVLEAPDE